MEASAKTRFKTAGEYLSAYPTPVSALLRQLRETIKKAAPEAEEIISYNMPAFKLHRILVWYAAHKEHIGFYPGASGIEAFKKELSAYKRAKGSVQFPFDKPLPLTLVSKIVQYRVKEKKVKADLTRKTKTRSLK